MILRILKKTTFKKILNALKLYSGYLISIFFKEGKRFAYPVSLSVEPTSVCNLNCPECPTGLGELTRYKGHIKFELYKKILDELSPYLLNLILYFQGEPFLNKEIFRLIEYSAIQKNVYTSISTNGHFLDSETAQRTVKSGLDKLIISLDGTDQETYEKYRKNGDLETVIQSIKNIVKWKEKLKSKTPYVVIQFLVFKFNEYQIPEIKRLSKELGVNKLELKSAQIYDYKNDTELIPDNKKYSRYKKGTSGKYQIKSKLKNKCKRLWEASVITNTGEVLPCCFDKDAKYSSGNIIKHSFKEINNNPASVNFRKKLLKNRKQIDICKNCTEGLRK